MDLDSDGEEKVRATHSRKAKSKVIMSAYVPLAPAALLILRPQRVRLGYRL